MIAIPINKVLNVIKKQKVIPYVVVTILNRTFYMMEYTLGHTFLSKVQSLLSHLLLDALKNTQITANLHHVTS